MGDLGLISGLVSSPGGGHGNPLQYPCLDSSLVAYSPWGRKESDAAERLSTAQHILVSSVKNWSRLPDWMVSIFSLKILKKRLGQSTGR